MKKVGAFTGAFFFAMSSFSQQVVNLEEDVPYRHNGLEYGYYVSNESIREVKGEEYHRYELMLYVSNKSGCLKLIPFRTEGNAKNKTSSDELKIAEFICLNATGKRLTARKGNVSANPWYTPVKIPDEQAKDKYRIVNAEAGFAIINGQTITSRIIVIVPKGERARVNCQIAYYPEFQ
ncbi:MAG: hypothetical protein JST10_15070 [Bacteroidetes bacterium]|nr:hypothetical protein [Bacteroidota bacterium]MBS1633883.1 hypothetical protein [Bacteroidota bacterium]